MPREHNINLEIHPMSRRTWKEWLQSSLVRRSVKAKPRKTDRTPRLEQLAERITPAINATFSAGILTVTGDNLDNTIEISRDAGGKLLVNGGAVKIKGGHADGRQHQADFGIRPRWSRHDHAQ